MEGLIGNRSTLFRMSEKKTRGGAGRGQGRKKSESPKVNITYRIDSTLANWLKAQKKPTKEIENALKNHIAMKKIKIEIDEIAAKFILCAILFQRESGIVFEHDTTDEDFHDCYGFSREDLRKSLDNLRSKMPFEKNIREKMFEGEYNHREIIQVSISDLRTSSG